MLGATVHWHHLPCWATFPNPLLGAESNSKQCFYSVTAMCHVAEKTKAPRRAGGLWILCYYSVIQMTVQQSVSALAGVFVKAPERTKSDKQGDLVSQRGAFQKVTVWSNLFYTGCQVSPGHIPRNNSARPKSIFQMRYCFCLIYMNAWCIFWLSKPLSGLLLESLQLAWIKTYNNHPKTRPT